MSWTFEMIEEHGNENINTHAYATEQVSDFVISRYGYCDERSISERNRARACVGESCEVHTNEDK